MVFLIIVSVSILFLLVALYFVRKPDKELAQKHKNGAVLLDVRSKGEFASATISGAINIPHNELAKRIDELDKSKSYITFCSQGVRSVKAKRALRSKGYLQSYNGGAIHDLERKLE